MDFMRRAITDADGASRLLSNVPISEFIGASAGSERARADELAERPDSTANQVNGVHGAGEHEMYGIATSGMGLSASAPATPLGVSGNFVHRDR